MDFDKRFWRTDMKVDKRILTGLIAVFVAITPAVVAQDLLSPVAGEYSLSGELGGNQVSPSLAFNESGGYVVWQDDSLDDDGTSIGAQRLNSNLSGSLSPLRVNAITSGNQEKPQIAMRSDGGAVIVWQSGEPGRQNIYLRVIRPDQTFVGEEIRVNQYASEFQIEPDVAVLDDQTVVVVWDSFDQDGHLRAVMGRRFSGDGEPLEDEFQINQGTHLNQRNAKVVGLAAGGFVVAWISERMLGRDRFGGTQFTADVMVRWYDAAGTARGNELRVSDGTQLCAHPAIAADGSGGVRIAWSQSSTLDRESGWNIRSTVFSATGVKASGDHQVNDHDYGDQYKPELAQRGSGLFVVWTSLGQDGSHEGVYGRALGADGRPYGEEIRVNTHLVNRQLHATIGVDPVGRFLVVWSSYSSGGNGFDLRGQRLAAAAPLPVLPAPLLTALSSTKIAVSWPELAGYDVAQYEIYIDDDPAGVTTDQTLTIEGLSPASVYSVRIAYRLSDARRGEPSVPAIASTWAEDDNFDGLPDDWQSNYWGETESDWPQPSIDSDGDGASNRAEFLAGTNPVDGRDVLAVEIENRNGSIWLNWNTRPGMIYAVQMLGENGGWNTYGKKRFAPEYADALKVGGGVTGLYRVVRLR